MPVSCQTLKHLHISRSKLKTFDLGLSPNLETLSLNNCADFEELHVCVACPNLKILDLCKSRLRSLDLELIPNLERLDLESCHELVEINAPVGCLKNVGYLNLSGCFRFPQFVYGGGCEPKVNCSSATLDLTGEFLDSCPLHPKSNLPKLQFRCYYDENLPSSVGNFEKLISFGLCACTDFKKFSDIIFSLQGLQKFTLKCNIPEFPKDLGQLECLEELSLYSTKIKHLRDGICMLKCLKSLDVTGCCRLGMLPEDIGQLESLERLDLSSTVIKHLPDSICMLVHLKFLNLSFCPLLEKLPEDLGQLECLEHLDITYTGISHLPQSIFRLKGLLIAAPRELLHLYDFPSEIETTTSPIWLETRVTDVVSCLEVAIDDVRMIGIKGIGGAGKTTTARAVFDHLSNHFEAKCFVENVREVSSASMFGLKKLQEQVLSEVLNKHVTLDSVDDGKDMMKKRMCSKKVLLVLDDVNHIEQLKALAGEAYWFKPGSRIIITTRYEQVLAAHRVNLNLLSDKEAICLFSRHAFGREFPSQGYEELSGKVVRYAAGLPLTIKVLGSFLCGKDKLEWLDAIDKLRRIPLNETVEKLELSYISLEDEYKEIFLDIACILKGQRKQKAIRILECCGFHARIGLEVLEQRSLITNSYGYDGKLVLGMHDHIEEIGKKIVRCLHPDEPNKHSRLWIKEEIEDILANDTGSEATRCLKLFISRGNSRILMEGLGKMKKLRYLELNLVWDFNSERDDKCLGSDLKLDESTQYFPNSIQYLKCTNYPFLYLPKTFQANNLVGLEMESSRRMVQLWEEGEKKVLEKLKYLSLSKSNLTTFDFRITPNLESLSLSYSLNLRELCMPVCCQKLKHLDISHSKLRTFDLGLTPNLETLSLESSGKLKELCMPVSCQKLNYLCISHSKLRAFDLGLTPNLETLSLLDCAQFEELHVSAACPNLKFLNLSKSRLRSLDLELIPNLESLDLAICDKLVEINAPVGCMKKVGSLNLGGSLRFTDFRFYGKEPKVNCSSATLALFGESVDSCPLHPNSNLPKLWFHCSYKEYLSSSVGNIEKLMPFVLCACTDFKKFSDMICSLQGLKRLTLRGDIPTFPKDLGQLECLEELCLSSTKITHLPDSICMLKHLKSLTVNHGDLLEKLPEDLGLLECLEKLHVSSEKIEYLPDSICMLKRLKSLDFTKCCRLGKLPGDIGQLESLERLVLSATMIKHLPDSICMLKHLKFLDLRRCALLEKLPEDLGRLECLEELVITRHFRPNHIHFDVDKIRDEDSDEDLGENSDEDLGEDSDEDSE